MTEFEKEVLNYLSDIRDRIEILISDSGNYLEDFNQFVAIKCDHPIDSFFCTGCRFKRACKKFYQNEE